MFSLQTPCQMSTHRKSMSLWDAIQERDPRIIDSYCSSRSCPQLDVWVRVFCHVWPNVYRIHQYLFMEMRSQFGITCCVQRRAWFQENSSTVDLILSSPFTFKTLADSWQQHHSYAGGSVSWFLCVWRKIPMSFPGSHHPQYLWGLWDNLRSVGTVHNWHTYYNPKCWSIILSRFEMVFFHKTLSLVNTVALNLHPHSKPLVHMRLFTFTLMTQLLIKASILSIQHLLVSKILRIKCWSVTFSR